MFNITDKMHGLNAHIKSNNGQPNIEFDDTNYTKEQRRITSPNEIITTAASITYSQNYGTVKQEKRLPDSCNRNSYSNDKCTGRYISYMDKIEATKWNHILEEVSKNEDRLVYYDIYKKEKKEEEKKKREFYNLKINQLVNLNAYLERPKYSQLINLETKIGKESKTSKRSLRSEHDREAKETVEYRRKINTNKEFYEILRLMENRKMGTKKKGGKKNSEMKVKGEEKNTESPNKQKNNNTNNNTIQQIGHNDTHATMHQNDLITIPDANKLHRNLKDTLITSDMHNGSNTGIMTMQKDFLKSENNYRKENGNDQSATLNVLNTCLSNKDGDVNKRNSFEKKIDSLQEKMHTYLKKLPPRCSISFSKSVEMGDEVIYKEKEEEGKKQKDCKENDRTHIYNIFRNFSKQKCNNVANAGVRSYLKNQERKNYNCDKKGVRTDAKENVNDKETEQLRSRRYGLFYSESLSLYEGSVDKNGNGSKIGIRCRNENGSGNGDRYENENDSDNTKNRNRIATLSDLNDFTYRSQNELKEAYELTKMRNIAFSVESMKSNARKKNYETEYINKNKNYPVTHVEIQNIQLKESDILKKKSVELGTENNPFSICRYVSKTSSKRHRQHDEKQGIETDKNSYIEENSGKTTEIHQMKHWNKKKWNEKSPQKPIHIKDMSKNKNNAESMSIVTMISGDSVSKVHYKNNNSYNNINNNIYKSISEINSVPVIIRERRNSINDHNNMKGVKEATLKCSSITKPMQKCVGLDNNRKIGWAIAVKERVKKKEKEAAATATAEEEEEKKKEIICGCSLLESNKTKKGKGKKKFGNLSTISQATSMNSMSSFVSSFVALPLNSAWSSTASSSSEKKPMLKLPLNSRYDKLGKLEKLEQKSKVERKKNKAENKYKNNLDKEKRNEKEKRMEKETKIEQEKEREGEVTMGMERKLYSNESRKRPSDSCHSIIDDRIAEERRKEKKHINKSSKRNRQCRKNNSNELNQRKIEEVEEYGDRKTNKGEMKGNNEENNEENNESHDDYYNEKESNGEWVVVQPKRRKDKKNVILNKKMYSNNRSKKKQNSSNNKDMKKGNKTWTTKRAPKKKEKQNVKDNEKKVEKNAKKIVETNKNNSEVNNQENSNMNTAINFVRKDDLKIVKEKSRNKKRMNYAQAVSSNEIAKSEQIGKKEIEMTKENNSFVFKENEMEREEGKEEEKGKGIEKEENSSKKLKYVENVNKRKKRKKQAFNKNESFSCINDEVYIEAEEEEEKEEEDENNDEKEDKEKQREGEKMEQNSNKQNDHEKNDFPNEGVNKSVADVSKNEDTYLCIGEKENTKNLQNNLLNGIKEEVSSIILHKAVNKTSGFLEQKKNMKQKEQNKIQKETVPIGNKNDNNHLQMNYYKIEQSQTVKPSDKNPFLKLMNEEIKETVQSQEEPSTTGNLFSVSSHNQLINSSMLSNTTIDKEYVFKQVQNLPVKYNMTKRIVNTLDDPMTMKTKRFSNERNIENFMVNNASKAFHRVNSSQHMNDSVFNLNNVMKTKNKINLQNFNVSFDFSNFTKNKKKHVENSVTQEYLNELNKIYFFIKNIQKKYTCSEKLRAIFQLLENEVENINIENICCFDSQRTLPTAFPSHHEEKKADAFSILTKEERMQKYEKEGTFRIKQTIGDNYKREWNYTGGSDFAAFENKKSKNHFSDVADYGKRCFFKFLEKKNGDNSNLEKYCQIIRFNKNRAIRMCARYSYTFRNKQKRFEIKNWHFKGKRKKNKKEKHVIKVNNIFALTKYKNSYLLFKTNTNKILKNVNWKNNFLKSKKQTPLYKSVDTGKRDSTEEDKKKLKKVEMKYYDELVSSDDEVTLIYKYSNGSDKPLYSLKKI